MTNINVLFNSMEKKIIDLNENALKKSYEKPNIVFYAKEMCHEHYDQENFDKYFLKIMNKYVKEWTENTNFINLENNNKKKTLRSFLYLFDCLNLNEIFKFDNNQKDGFDFQNYKQLVEQKEIFEMENELTKFCEIIQKTPSRNLNFNFAYLDNIFDL